jgi:hypothetical protein
MSDGEGTMSAATSNVQLELVDGTACSALFTAGDGVTISKQGQPCGSISDAELSEFAARRNGAMELAAQIEGTLGEQALTTRSQDALMDSAFRWFELHY